MNTMCEKGVRFPPSILHDGLAGRVTREQPLINRASGLVVEWHQDQHIEDDEYNVECKPPKPCCHRVPTSNF
jgi:hypothetical protein